MTPMQPASLLTPAPAKTAPVAPAQGASAQASVAQGSSDALAVAVASPWRQQAPVGQDLLRSQHSAAPEAQALGASVATASARKGVAGRTRLLPLATAVGQAPVWSH